MKAKPKARAMEKAPDSNLRFRVLAPNGAHVLAAPRSGVNIHREFRPAKRANRCGSP